MEANLNSDASDHAEINRARVAELADALDSKSSSRKGVGVRFPPLVLNKNKGLRGLLFKPFFFVRDSVHVLYMI